MGGQPECYRFEGLVYPDEVNCHFDIEDQKLSAADYSCPQVDTVGACEAISENV
ncbi:hypothetical protein D3C75_1126740 [compost metagenome]|jgi:hypothetical protein